MKSGSREWATRMPPPHVRGLPSQGHALLRAIGRLELTSGATAVLRVLCEMADGAGFCHPSVRRLIQDSGYSERSVFRALGELERDGHLTRYPTLRDRARFGEHLPRNARQGQGPTIYRVGSALRTAAGLLDVDVTEHLGLVAAEHDRPVAPPEPEPLAPPESATLAPPVVGTPQWHPPNQAVLPASWGVPSDRGWHPSTENGKPFTEEEPSLVRETSTAVSHTGGVQGGTDDETFLAALTGSTEPRATPALGDVVTCRRHGPRPVVQVTAGIAYLRCGCQAVEEPARA